MKEIQEIVRAFERNHGQPLALATLVRARGSSYRRPGARMLIVPDGSTVGTLSGGCLEEEVALRAQEVIRTGVPSLMSFDTRLRFGCHGAIEVFLEKLREEFLEEITAALRVRRTVYAVTVFDYAHSLGSSVLASLEDGPDGAFVQAIQPPLRLVLVGEGPDSPPLKSFAAILGWPVIETEQVAGLPNELDDWTAVVVKTHHYGRDYAALEALLPLGLRYLALLGPRRRRDQLLHALFEAGVAVHSELFAPAGLDLGAESPEEIALAIVAEIQTTFAEAKSESLRDRKVPIHLAREVAAAAAPA